MRNHLAQHSPSSGKIEAKNSMQPCQTSNGVSILEITSMDQSLSITLTAHVSYVNGVT